MSIVDISILYFQNTLETNTGVHKTLISKIRYKPEDLANRFAFVPTNKAASNV